MTDDEKITRGSGVFQDLGISDKKIIMDALKMLSDENAFVAANAAMALDRMTKVRCVNIDDLAQYIRQINGNNDMGAGALAENISDYLITKGLLNGSNTAGKDGE